MDRFLSQDDTFREFTPTNLYDSVPLVDNRRFYLSHSPSVHIVSPLTELKSILAVEKIVNHNFINKNLLKEALTHSSCTDSPSLERLAFVGDSAIGLALTNHLYLVYPNLEPDDLSLLRSANVSTEKLARVAINHGLYQFLRRTTPSLDEKVLEFSNAVSKEDNSVAYGGLVKAPKVLADIVESVAGAIYNDVNLDLERFWVIFRGLLEPIFTLDDLLRQPQPVTMLYHLCHKRNKQIDIRFLKDGNSSVVDVYLDDVFFASGRAEHKDIAKLIAAREAIRKLGECMPIEMVIDEGDVDVEVGLENAKQKLIEICMKKKWPKPIYSVEEEGRTPSGKRMVCAVKIKLPNEEGTLYMKGDEEHKKTRAENSSAYHMIRALRNSKFL